MGFDTHKSSNDIKCTINGFVVYQHIEISKKQNKSIRDLVRNNNYNSDGKWLGQAGM